MARTTMKPIFPMLQLVLTVGLSHNLLASGLGGDHEQFIYTGFTGSKLTLDGAATITPAGLVGLTNETFRIKGHAFHPAPVRFRESSSGTVQVQSFSVSFVFGILSSFGDIRGHGFAFFIAPSKDLSIAFPIQFLGLVNDTNNGSVSNHLFAVELDTILNTEFGDIDNNHVGIDVNSLNSVRSFTAGFYDDTRPSVSTASCASTATRHAKVNLLLNACLQSPIWNGMLLHPPSYDYDRYASPSTEKEEDAMEAQGLKAKFTEAWKRSSRKKDTRQEGRHCRSGRPALPPRGRHCHPISTGTAALPRRLRTTALPPCLRQHCCPTTKHIRSEPLIAHCMVVLVSCFSLNYHSLVTPYI
ncbi:hypothetical protein ACQ4PT_019303 [Festuca glaucescens]